MNKVWVVRCSWGGVVVMVCGTYELAEQIQKRLGNMYNVYEHTVLYHIPDGMKQL